MKKVLLFTILVFLFSLNLVKAQWVETLNYPGPVEIYSIAALNQKIFCGSTNIIYISTNEGKTWASKSAPFTIYDLIATENKLFAVATGTGQLKGIFYSTDEGNSWVNSNNDITTTNVSCLALNGQNMFAGTTAGIFLSTNNGNNWTAVNNGLTNLAINGLASISSKIFATTTTGLFVSTNLGTNWTFVSTGLTSIYWKSLSAKDSIILVNGYNGFAFSTNSGDNWTLITSLGSYIGNEILGSTLVVNSRYKFYHSTDFGNTWFPALNDFEAVVKVVNKILSVGDYSYMTRGIGGPSGGIKWYGIWIYNAHTPAFLSPANYARGTPLNLNFKWSKVSGVTSYGFILATDSLFTNVIVSDSLSDTFKVVSNLSYSKKYYWKVKTVLNNNWQPTVWWHNEFTTAPQFTKIDEDFETSNFPPEGWKKIYLGNNTPIQILRDTAHSHSGRQCSYSETYENWLITPKINNIQFIDSISFWVKKRYSGTSGYDSLIVKVSSTDTAMSSFTSDIYKINVNNSDDYNNIKAGLGSFTGQNIYIAFQHKTNGNRGLCLDDVIIKSYYSSPLLNYPLQEAIQIPVNTYFKWFKTYNAMGYCINIATDSLFNNIILNDSSLVDTVKFVNNLSLYTNYWWRVKSKYSHGWETFSNAWKFRTTFGIPALINPPNLSSNISLTPTLDWSDQLGVTGYILQLSQDSAFSSLVFSDTNRNVSYYPIPSGLFTLNTKYYWRVKGRENSILGDFSTIYSFTTYSNTQSMWTWQNPLPQGNTINGMHFINSGTGWATGDGGLIIKTTNGGTNWIIQTQNIPYSLNSIYFLNLNTGFVTGQSGTLLKTTNSGYNWSPINFGASKNLNCIKFFDNNTGWIVGNNSAIYKTTNGGTSWDQKTYGTSVNLSSLNFIDVNIGWACGSNGTIIRTLDGGNNWIPQTSGITSQLNSITTPDVYNGWACGTGGVILRTTNGGVSWASQSSGSTQQIKCIQFLNTNTGYAVGDSGKVYKTINAGTNWTVQISGTTNSLNSVSFADANLGFFGGTGTISKTINGGLNWSTLIQGTNQALNNVFLINANTGWAVGNYGTSLYTTNGGSTWNSQPTSITQNLNSVHFVNSNTGWSVGNLGTIIKTTNAGSTWLSQVSGVANNLNSVFFVTDSIGWSSGTGIILKTNLSGAFWVSQFTNGTVPINSLYFLNLNTGWACGGSGFIYKTTNSGTNWTQIVTNSSEVHNSIKFANQNLGWSVGNSGMIYRSTNSGINWTAQISGVSSNLNSVFVVDSLNLYAVGTGGQILKTSNSGANWNIQSSPTANDLKSVHFVNSTFGWTVGTNGTILKVNTNFPSIPTAPISISPPNNSTGNPLNPTLFWFKSQYAVNYQLLLATDSLFNNIILNDSTLTDSLTTLSNLSPLTKYFWKVRAKNPLGWGNFSDVWCFTTTVATDLNLSENGIPTKYELNQNFPNPFNAMTLIKYAIPKPNIVQIKLYDLLGREVKVLVNKIQKAGYYTIRFNAINLSSGIYFVKMQSGDFSDIKKIILIK